MRMRWLDGLVLFYGILLIAFAIFGFVATGSKMSLIMSATFAVILILFNLDYIKIRHGADFVLLFLLLFFTMRLVKSKKMMPNGMMAILTLAALILRNVHLG